MDMPALPPAATVPAMAPVAVLVVDDQLSVREGLTRLIACAPLALRTVASAATAADALRLAALLRPEVVVLDVDLAGDDGLALIPLFGPAVAVLVLSCHGDRDTRERAARLGASAFVEKHQPAAELLGAIVALATPHSRGDIPLDRQGIGSHALAVASSGAAEPRCP